MLKNGQGNSKMDISNQSPIVVEFKGTEHKGCVRTNRTRIGFILNIALISE
ncbi:hypothetical protein BDD43_5400 [Mucilaginibacter gracilis]|uniref:Uncharacterized protein n=1 Tax=Mucilaginibacter gracilis TaxID=423350 RepID=A0A495J817_9SPHI|nr:hypothetical protein BDD43_5400 [Mucilaginibacter gracilis]